MFGEVERRNPVCYAAVRNSEGRASFPEAHRMTNVSRYAPQTRLDSLHVATKVPEVTLVFWIIKIAATTLGETGGDSVTMTLGWGYLAGTMLFLTAMIVLVAVQIMAKRFHPVLYWATIVASTTFGTTMADFADRSLGIGYTGGSALLARVAACDAGALVLVAGLDLGRDGQHAEGRGVLLGGNHVFTNPRNGARRLDGRRHRPRLRRRRAGVRGRAGVRLPTQAGHAFHETKATAQYFAVITSQIGG
jgi:repeat uncharacterized protein DUF347